MSSSRARSSYLPRSKAPSNGTRKNLIDRQAQVRRAAMAVFETLEPRQLLSAAFYGFEEGSGTTAADASGHGNTATLHGGVAWTTAGRDGSAVTLDGTSGYLQANSSANLQTSGAVTVAAWVRLNGTESDQKIASNEDGTAGGFKLGVYQGKVEFEIRDASNQFSLNRWISGGTTLGTGTWYHVAGVYDPTAGTISTYVNGMLDRQLTTTGTLAAGAGDLVVGRDSAQPGGYLDGSLDDLRVYDSALTASQISNLFSNVPPDGPVNLSATSQNNAITLTWTQSAGAASYSVYRGTASGAEGATPIASGITTPYYVDTTAVNGTTYYYTVAAVNSYGTGPSSREDAGTARAAGGPLSSWEFNEGSGTTTADTGTSSGHTGSLSGGVTWTSSGRSGSALTFDGTSGYVAVPSSGDLDLSGQVTVSAWVNVASDSGDMKVASNEDGTAGGYKLAVYNGKAEFEVRDASNQFYLNRSVSDGTTLTPGIWYQITGVYSRSGQYIKTYVNGVLDRYLATSGILAAGSGNLVIGKEPFAAGGYFNGSIDGVQVYNSALPSAQIKSLAGTTAVPDAPIALQATFTGTTAQLSWQNVSDNATSNIVRYTADGGQTWNTVGSYSASTTSAAIGNLPETSHVTVQVVAANAAGSSASSASGKTGTDSTIQQFFRVSLVDAQGIANGIDTKDLTADSSLVVEAKSPEDAINKVVTGKIDCDLTAVPGVGQKYTYTFPSNAFVIRNDPLPPDGQPYDSAKHAGLNYSQTTGLYTGHIGLEDATDAPSGYNDMDYNDRYFDVTVTPVPQCSTCAGTVSPAGGGQSGTPSLPTPSGSTPDVPQGGANVSTDGTGGDGTNGSGTTSTATPGLQQSPNGDTVTVAAGPNAQSTFTHNSDGSFTEAFGGTDTLTHDTANARYVLTNSSGTTIYFHDYSASTTLGLQGRYQGASDAGGDQTAVLSATSAGAPAEIQSTNVAGTVVNDLLYAYLPAGDPNVGLVSSITERQPASGGGWQTVRVVSYSYYDGTQSSGNAGRLMTATTTDGSGNVIDQGYYRYALAGPAANQLTFSFGTASLAQLEAAYPGAALDSLSDTQVRPYADAAYGYDELGRVSVRSIQGAGCSSCSGGVGTYTYAYATSGNVGGPNSWSTKQTLTQPDGSQIITYANANGQTMLSVTVDTTTHQMWGTFYAYDAGGRQILSAQPSAVQLPLSLATLEANPDLLGQTGVSAAGYPEYQYLSSNSGLINLTDYPSGTTATGPTSAGSAANYVLDTKIEHGDAAIPVLQESLTYYAVSGGGSTIYPVATDTTYANTDGTGGRTTSYTYTWQAGTVQMASKTTTLPVVSAGQNGPGTADASTSVFDASGRVIWSKDARGFLTYNAYDPTTGALVTTISDVDTSNTSDYDTATLPGGWATPTGGGLNLVTSFQVDALGRTTQEVSPNGNTTYAFYKDALDPSSGFVNEVRVYPGWHYDASLGQYTTTGPVQVTRYNEPGSYSETLSYPYAPESGVTTPTGTDAISTSSIQSLSRSILNTAGQTVETNAYFSLAGVTYSAASVHLGTASNDSGTGNYSATFYGYDDLGRQNHVVDATGTATDTFFDVLGRVSSTWVGTDDVPPTDLNGDGSINYEDFTDTIAAGNPAPSGTNMVEVSTKLYDDGGIGDGNLTETIVHPGGGQADRATLNYYDWRDRLVASKQGAAVDSSGNPTLSAETDGAHRPISYTVYDNLNEAVTQEAFDGDGVTITSTAGVPDAPSSSLLRTKSVSSYDAQGRVFQSTTFSVDPSSGAVGSGITSNTFYDHNGNPLATYIPGQPTSKNAYDGAGRVVASYTTDGGAVNNGGTPLMSWSDAGSVAHDVVVSETDTTFDGDGNALLTTAKDRLSTADTTTEGALTGTLARISYVADYYDAADRTTAQENVGTNGGSAWTRPSTPDASDDTHLVTTTAYNVQGLPYLVTDPRGISTLTTYNLLGWATQTIAASDGGSPSSASNQTTNYSFNGNGDVLTMTAVMPSGTPSQTTAYVYGVGTGTGSTLFSNDLIQMVQYPDAATGDAGTSAADQVAYAYDGTGEKIAMTDQDGTTHSYSYDVLGRLTLDSVQVASGNPQNVDTSVLAMGYSYNTQGLPYQQTSYSDAAGTTVVNQDQEAYNGFGQLTGEYQSVSGAVNTSSTPEVQYVYSSVATGSLPTEMIYPNGRILHYGYDNNALDAALGRVDYLADDNGSGSAGSHLADYSYLGVSTILGQADGNGVMLTTTLDNLGRVAGMNWVNTSTSSSTDHLAYGYDRNDNVLYKNNLVNSAFSELYHANSAAIGDNNTAYDPLNRLSGFFRGTLTSSGNNGSALDTVISGNLNTLAGSSQSWNLDALGNQTATVTDGTTTAKTQNSKNELTGLGSATLAYDNNGNTTSDENGNTLKYDAWNRLVLDTNPSSTVLASYTFSANSRRITETHGSATTILYSSSQGEIIEERQGGVTAQNVWSIDYINALLLRDGNSTGGNLGISGSGLGTRIYAQHDAEFNITSLTDNNGNVLQRYAYGAYGETAVLSSSWVGTTDAYSWSYLFQGMRYDSITGLFHARDRDFSPGTETWLESDPQVYIDGANTYQFALSAPTDFTDPSGDSAKDLIKNAITRTAEWIYQFLQKHPLSPANVARANTVIARAKPAAASYYNTNPATMGWWDLTMAWFWELNGNAGGGSTFSFGPTDATTADVKTHTGVNDARKLASQQFAKLVAGNWDKSIAHSIDHDYSFGVDQAFTTLKDRDKVAAFLGSYHIHVDIACAKDNPKAGTFSFIVSNTTGWESGTRFRKAGAGGGQHLGVIKDRLRGGPGIQVGGTIKEIWKWQEKAQ
jgi:RHS repeat-associated protein